MSNVNRANDFLVISFSESLHDSREFYSQAVFIGCRIFMRIKEILARIGMLVNIPTMHRSGWSVPQALTRRPLSIPYESFLSLFFSIFFFSSTNKAPSSHISRLLLFPLNFPQNTIHRPFFFDASILYVPFFDAFISRRIEGTTLSRSYKDDLLRSEVINIQFLKSKIGKVKIIPR